MAEEPKSTQANAFVAVRMTRAEKAKIEKIARNEGRSVSNLMRYVIVKWLTDRNKAVSALQQDRTDGRL